MSRWRQNSHPMTSEKALRLVGSSGAMPVTPAHKMIMRGRIGPTLGRADFSDHFDFDTNAERQLCDTEGGAGMGAALCEDFDHQL